MCTKLLAVKLRVELPAMEPKLSCDGGDDGDDGGGADGGEAGDGGDLLLLFNVHCRALPSTSATVAVRMVTISPSLC